MRYSNRTQEPAFVTFKFNGASRYKLQKSQGQGPPLTIDEGDTNGAYHEFLIPPDHWLEASGDFEIVSIIRRPQINVNVPTPSVTVTTPAKIEIVGRQSEPLYVLRGKIDF